MYWISVQKHHIGILYGEQFGPIFGKTDGPLDNEIGIK